MSNATNTNSIPSVRARLTTIDVSDSNKTEIGYNFYPSRHLIKEEFNQLWDSQARFHGAVLTNELKQKLCTIIFYQRRLKPQKVGRCLYSQEDRIPKSHPLFQRRILYETVNSLRIRKIGIPSRALKIDERDKSFLHLITRNLQKAYHQ